MHATFESIPSMLTRSNGAKMMRPLLVEPSEVCARFCADSHFALLLSFVDLKNTPPIPVTFAINPPFNSIFRDQSASAKRRRQPCGVLSFIRDAGWKYFTHRAC